FVEQYFIENHHHIAALIVEPLIQCANQMFFYAPAYLQGLVALCRQYEIHVIADEIAVGMGRTGTLFACEQAGICPDLMCLSKGISGGTLPLSLVLSRDEIYHAFLGEEPKQAFLHSHSYSGNALACRAAVKTLSLLLDEGVLESVSSKGNKIKMLISNALSGRAVKNLRQLGMIIAFDVINAPPDFAQRFFQIALTHQVMIRPIGDTVYIMPSYLITDCEIEILIDGIVKTLQEIGTDTEIGKTWVSASLLYALKQAGVDCIGMKPVASGAQKISGQWVNEDSSLHLWACRLRNAPIDLINPYIFEEAIAPHIAAEHQGVKIRKSVILNAYVYLKKSYPRYCVVVEGAGGILVPLSAKWNMAKLAQKMELPIVLVVGIRLGAINHALLSYELILQKNLPWAGWVANVVDANLSAHRSLLESHLAFLQAKMGKPLA
ncbi:unnamed protein product, partial [Darwinula stevensoni]